MQFNIFNVWLRDTSPAAIKSEPEEDNGFYPSPQHKSTKREYDDEEWVSSKINLITIVTLENLLSIGLCHEIHSDDQSAVYRFEYKPKKVKTEHDKKAKKRKHEYEEDEEDEVYFVFHITLMNMLSYSPGWLISSFMFSSFILFSPLVF